MKRRLPTLALLLASILGCEPTQAPTPSAPATEPIANLPIELTARQRTTQAVPGSGGQLEITLDDITRGQVLISLASGKDVVLPQRSMKRGDAATFRFRDVDYRLTLRDLDNQLVGQDAATFVIDTNVNTGLSEAQKIDRLLADVAAATGTVFIRNGDEHGAASAAKHLRSKYESQADKITSARQFIDEIASTSSTSGKPYRVRLPDGREMDASAYFNERLADLESAK